MAMFCSFAKPFDCFCRILWNAFAVAITTSKRELGSGVSLVSGHAPPFNGFSTILSHTYAVIVAAAEVALGLGITLFGIFSYRQIG